jgi:hypothetical protein
MRDTWALGLEDLRVFVIPARRAPGIFQQVNSLAEKCLDHCESGKFLISFNTIAVGNRRNSALSPATI